MRKFALQCIIHLMNTPPDRERLKMNNLKKQQQQTITITLHDITLQYPLYFMRILRIFLVIGIAT